MKPTYQLDDPATAVYVGDCRIIMKVLPKKSVDLNWDVPYGEWDDARPREVYLGFTRAWLDGCIRVLKDSGTLWVNIPNDTAAEIVVHLKHRGLTLINWCIWHFRFGQHRAGNFIVSKVHALYFAKDRANRTWNPHEVLEASDRAAIYDDPRTRETRQPGKRVPLDVWYGQNWAGLKGTTGSGGRPTGTSFPRRTWSG